MNTGYILKVTYVDGVFAGRTYFLNKPGYVVDVKQSPFYVDCVYKNLKRAQNACNRKQLESIRFANDYDYPRAKYIPYEVPYYTL